MGWCRAPEHRVVVADRRTDGHEHPLSGVEETAGAVDAGKQHCRTTVAPGTGQAHGPEAATRN